jgi:ADP-ribosylglycohydrolase
MKDDRVVGGILGVVTGDALGLPVQFLSRSQVRKNPVTEMRGGGAFDTPPGTWSDDSSLTLCLTESLILSGYDLRDIADRFVKWYRDGYMTPFGQPFDIGYATSVAIGRLMKGLSPFESGPAGEEDNGNGSLMRILPAAIYFSNLPERELIEKICEVSKITHGHPRSQLGCSLYALFIKGLLAGENPGAAYRNMSIKAHTVFEGTQLENELLYYKRLIDNISPELYEDEIKSTGYVVDTLEAATWCFLTTNSFKEALLKAVNLGLDTDTVGAVTGGLAGVYYGLEGIPEEWLSMIIKKDEILEASRKFANVVKYSLPAE